MEKTKNRVVIRLERGALDNGTRIKTAQVFSLSSPGAEKRIKPCRTVQQEKKTREQDHYSLSTGGRYRIETAITKDGKTSTGKATLTVGENGDIKTVDWEGFCPRFSIVP
jgi:hypothetical protein